jgi:hypothetical protein
MHIASPRFRSLVQNVLRYAHGVAVVHPAGRLHAPTMFTVSDAEAAAIRTAFEGGELSAALEMRRLFPGISDNVKARAFARMITGRTPRPEYHAQSLELRDANLA